MRPCVLSMLSCIVEEADMTVTLLETLLKPLMREEPSPASR